MKIGSARGYLSRTKAKVEGIRSSRSFGANARLPRTPESVRESNAREFFARAVILPLLKRTFGPSLKAAVMPGSAQIGVRLSTRKRKRSDLDISVAIEREPGTENTLNQEVKHHEAALRKIAHEHGIDLSVGVFDHKTFVELERDKNVWKGQPFQTLYGSKWLRRKMGKRFFRTMPARREEFIKTREKYKQI